MNSQRPAPVAGTGGNRTDNDFVKPMTTITPEALAARITSGDAPIILDVRSRGEFKRGHVPGAIHIPFWNIRGQALPVAPHECDSIVVYCGHGPRAWMAGASLRRRGFSRIVYLAGHMSAWSKAGLPEQTQKPGRHDDDGEK